MQSSLGNCRETFFNCRDLHLKKKGQLFQRSISITADSLLSNVEDNKFKKVFDKCKVIHALKQPKHLLHLLSKPKVQNCISEKCGFYNFLAINVRIPVVIYAHRIYKNVQVSWHQMNITASPPEQRGRRVVYPPLPPKVFLAFSKSP